ncbi:GNAT family N-acetyltransferase [Streptomyces sp. DSM 41987]|uniref:GNAT family N-acetyltransferase n=1 Tax=Streptomyces TaxID=1883 RepID=UPI0018DF993D|nr:GNAT family N-acetyltransferase [Streptomyces fildesensis]
MEDLVTARLVLHPMSVVEARQVMAGVPGEGARWAPGYPDQGDVAGARRFLNTCEQSGDPQPFGAYELRRREDDLVMGGLGFHGPADENGGVTIGYGLVPAARGHGYAGEALRALLVFARARGISRVHGDTARENIASQRVMAAAGMRLVAEDERLRYYTIEWTGMPGTTSENA